MKNLSLFYNKKDIFFNLEKEINNLLRIRGTLEFNLKTRMFEKTLVFTSEKKNPLDFNILNVIKMFYLNLLISVES